MTIAVDSDVLIYSADKNNPLGRRILAKLVSQECIGSCLLLPETQIKPTRIFDLEELRTLNETLESIILFPVSELISVRAVGFGAQYGLKTVDAVHLATAVHHNAQYFLTNNKKDFPKSIVEIEILYPEDLPELTD